MSAFRHISCGWNCSDVDRRHWAGDEDISQLLPGVAPVWITARVLPHPQVRSTDVTGRISAQTRSQARTHTPHGVVWPNCSFTDWLLQHYSCWCTKDSNGQVTASVERCCACRHRHLEVWPQPGSNTARRTSLARRPWPVCFSSWQWQFTGVWTAVHRRTCRTTAIRPPVSTLGSTCVPPTVIAIGSTLTAVGPFQLQSGTLSRISSGTRPSVQTVSDVCLKRICSLNTSALEILDDNRAV